MTMWAVANGAPVAALHTRGVCSNEHVVSETTVFSRTSQAEAGETLSPHQANRRGKGLVITKPVHEARTGSFGVCMAATKALYPF